MLKSRDWTICALAAALSLSASASQAALFDFLNPKRPAAPTARAQSPERRSAARGASAPGWQPAGGSRVVQASYSEQEIPSGWGYDSSPCFNCGDCDHNRKCLPRCRKFWGQTWYPRLAPYCQAGWGWHQPCWRRMADNYNCPRPEVPVMQSPVPASPPLPAPPPAAEPALPEPPAVPTSSAAPVTRVNSAARTAGYLRAENPFGQRQPPRVEPNATRFTSYADTLEPEKEADEELDDEMPADTLESQMQAADGDAGDDETADGDAADGDQEAPETADEMAEDSDPPAIDE